eukprot:COSAG01_NODE_7594_length_3134_cov_5.924547_1_plen_157_part_00
MKLPANLHVVYPVLEGHDSINVARIESCCDRGSWAAPAQSDTRLKTTEIYDPAKHEEISVPCKFILIERLKEAAQGQKKFTFKQKGRDGKIKPRAKKLVASVSNIYHAPDEMIQDELLKVMQVSITRTLNRKIPVTLMIFLIDRGLLYSCTVVLSG